MQRATIVRTTPNPQNIYGATTENTHLSLREKLEETMLNLATHLGGRIVHKALIRDGSYIYAVDDESFQSASNTILSLSRRL